MVNNSSSGDKQQVRNKRLDLFSRAYICMSTAIGIFISIVYIFDITFFGIFLREITFVFLIGALFLPTAFLTKPARRSDIARLPWYDILFSCLSFAIPFYFAFHYHEIELLGWEMKLPLPQLVFAAVFILVTLEGSRRVVNLFFALFVVVIMLYPTFAFHLPGLLSATPFSLVRVISNSMVGGDGFMGVPMLVLCKILLGFLVFGMALTFTGGSNAFLVFAMSLFGKSRGGTAKVSVVSSALIASISGSVLTNIISSGAFTIPSMKKAGYTPEYAAAVETCSSTGGVLLPPVMGASAFIMAAFLNVSYATVAQAAVVPALLYYFSLLIQVDAYARRKGLKGLTESEIPSLMEGIKEILIYGLIIVLLIYMLLFLRREAQAAFYATLILFIIAAFRKKTRMSLSDFMNFLQKVGEITGQMIPILAGIGYVIGSLYLTGLADNLSVAIVSLAGNSIILLVVLAAISSFILGMGLTVTACYVLLAVVVAPAMVQAGFETMSAHLFILYCGMLSYITPPVAIGAYAAAGIAEANPFSTGFKAVRIGILIFIIPILFVFNPAFILNGSTPEILRAVGGGVVSVILLASAIEGYLLGMGTLSLVDRFVFVVSSFMFFNASLITQALGVVILLLFITLKVFWKCKVKTQKIH